MYKPSRETLLCSWVTLTCAFAARTALHKPATTSEKIENKGLIEMCRQKKQRQPRGLPKVVFMDPRLSETVASWQGDLLIGIIERDMNIPCVHYRLIRTSSVLSPVVASTVRIFPTPGAKNLCSRRSVSRGVVSCDFRQLWNVPAGTVTVSVRLSVSAKSSALSKENS